MSRGNNDILRGLKDIKYYAAPENRGEYAITEGSSIYYRLYHTWVNSYVTRKQDILKMRRLPDLYIILTNGVP